MWSIWVRDFQIEFFFLSTGHVLRNEKISSAMLLSIAHRASDFEYIFMISKREIDFHDWQTLKWLSRETIEQATWRSLCRIYQPK